MINNYEGAIDCAIKANRIFEAFMIAYSHPKDGEYYINYLVDKYSYLQSDYFLKNFLQPLTKNDYESIINSYDVKEWKDILTFIVKNVNDVDSRNKFYDTLVNRVKESQEDNLIIKYIYLFADNTDKFCEFLLKELIDNQNDYVE